MFDPCAHPVQARAWMACGSRLWAWMACGSRTSTEGDTVGAPQAGTGLSGPLPVLPVLPVPAETSGVGGTPTSWGTAQEHSCNQPRRPQNITARMAWKNKA